MSASTYSPTELQQAIIDHEGAIFVTACPGAGKTRTMVERARKILSQESDRRGVAFLSFTNAAVDELQIRLNAFGVLPSPLFPGFIGTFDRFLWQFLISPFGIPDCDAVPKLVPDKNEWEVVPFPKAHALRLRCFDRATGKVDPASARKEGFDVQARSIDAHETRVLSILKTARSHGQIDFDDVRVYVRERLDDKKFADRVGRALAARFREIVVDEAQDCNPADLDVVDWLRRSGIIVKVICDPNQSIYKFRGGVTNELEKFSNSFGAHNCLHMSGNFRSTPAICLANVALRAPNLRANPDRPVGRYRDDSTPVHIISYSGTAVSQKIGRAFLGLVNGIGVPLQSAPVLASTRASACKAIGQPVVDPTTHMTLLLAEAAMKYHFAFAVGGRRDALIGLHRVILLVQGHISSSGDYHVYLTDKGLDDGSWRPDVIALANGLRFEPPQTVDQWLETARELLAPGCTGQSTIKMRLKAHQGLGDALAGAPFDLPPARTIHSVKGLEFPAVCVVMTIKTAGGILDLLEGRASLESDEEARKIYVAASRAERLLAIAVPKSRASRLQAILTGVECPTQLHQV
ncbi:ATP-dependent helicase [Paraburkholderia sp. UYCP14C]|uniref:ATP-dependent helicase n=1 Tax=Paraburkholderia sp. UYCP14C TaxID=2511130 RepID=UPI00101E8DD5|nr:ATP-dependent helicase [Paraburkholderia sp. UYCP14C]RZF24684.1 ATP-dependent helicase [Paraburkholderia sp. UYCP14C]